MFSRFSKLNVLSWFKKEREEQQPKVEDQIEFRASLHDFERIIAWEHPWFSLYILGFVNAFFWLVRSLNSKFYSTLFALLFVFSVNEAWTTRIWPSLRSVAYRMPFQSGVNEQWIVADSESSDAEDVKEFVRYLRIQIEILCFTMKDLRYTHKFLFSTILTALSVLMIMIGNAISGFWLAYIVITTILVGPVIYVRLIPDLVKTSTVEIVTTLKVFFIDNDPNADDEFLPEMSEETMNQLNEAYSLLLHEKTDTEVMVDESLLMNNSSAAEQLEVSSTTSSVSSDLSFLKSSSSSSQEKELLLPADKELLHDKEMSRYEKPSSAVRSSTVSQVTAAESSTTASTSMVASDLAASANTNNTTRLNLLSDIITDNVQTLLNNYFRYRLVSTFFGAADAGKQIPSSSSCTVVDGIEPQQQQQQQQNQQQQDNDDFVIIDEEELYSDD